MHTRLRQIAFPALLPTLLCLASAHAQRPMNHIGEDGSRSPTLCTVRLTNSSGLPHIPSYACPTFTQSVEELSPTAIRVTVSVAQRLPKPEGAWPMRSALEPDVSAYAEPTLQVQSRHPAIARTAESILRKTAPTTQAELVEAVCTWTRGHLRYQYSGTRDAVTAFEDGRASCVGYSHLTAALLRSLGMPARTVRTLTLRGCDKPNPSLGRHSFVEVYFPEARQWVLYDPQLPVAPSPAQIYMYSSMEWDPERNKACSAFCSDPKTRVELLTLR